MTRRADTTVASTRALKVFEALCVHGPSSLTEVAQRVGGTKSTVWRSLAHLVKLGWVHTRMVDGRYLVGNRLDQLLGMAEIALPEQEVATALVKHISSDKKFFARIGVLASGSRYSVLDASSGSENLQYAVDPRDIVGFAATLAGFSGNTEQRIQAFLRQNAMDAASQADLDSELRYLLQNHTQTVIEAPYNLEIAAKIRFATGTIGALVLKSRNFMGRNWPSIVSEAHEIFSSLADTTEGQITFVCGSLPDPLDPICLENPDGDLLLPENAETK